MNKHLVKSIGWAAATFAISIVLISLVSTVTLIYGHSGNDTMTQTTHLFGLTVFTIHSDRSGFEVTNGLGSIVLPITMSVMTLVTSYFTQDEKLNTKI